jgi:hypothetical protein
MKRNKNNNKLIVGITIAVYIVVVICLVITLVTVLVKRASQKDKTQEPTTETETFEEETIEHETSVVESDDAVASLRVALEATDIDTKIESFEKSASLGNTDAMYFLGEIYFQGIGVESDHVKAAEYLEKACSEGNSKAFSLYAKMLFLGDSTYQDYDESASYFYTLTESDAEACYVYAVMANLGLGMPRNVDRALSYVDKAVTLGYGSGLIYKDKIVDVGSMPMDIFDYTPQAKKITDLSYTDDNEDLETLIEGYKEELESTEEYTAFYTELENLKDIDIVGISTLTYFGNGGYMFHMNASDGNSLHDYMADEYYSDSELKAIADNLLAQREYVESKGSKFVVLLIPNKENVYYEDVPSYVTRESEVTRQDKLVEYLKNNTDLDIVYTKDTLLDNKEDFQLYYKTDTHANMVGSLFILSDLFEDLFGDKIDVSLDKFDIHMETYLGDLGNLAAATERYASDTVYFYPEGSVSEEDKKDSSIMLVGDSFSEFLNIEAGYYFTGGVDHRMITEYGFDYETAMKAGFKDSTPDYVVWEVVERYLDRLE